MSNKREIRPIFVAIAIVFAAFLILPLAILFIRSFEIEQGFGLSNYVTVLNNPDLMQSIWNSVKVSGLTAVITTSLAFILAYSINCTRIYRPLKSIINIGILIPMLLPTITYGFAIIYSFGKQGLITQIIGR